MLLFTACLETFPTGKENTFVDNPADDFDGDGQTEEEGDCDDNQPTKSPPASSIRMRVAWIASASAQRGAEPSGTKAQFPLRYAQIGLKRSGFVRGPLA